MNPKNFASRLRQLATSIEKANHPSRAKVASQLRKLMHLAMGPDDLLGSQPFEVVLKSPELYTPGWVNMHFNGDADAATAAEHEAYSVIESNTGCKMTDNETPGEIYFSCPDESAFQALETLLAESASERPDDYVDLFLALMDSGHTISRV